MTTVTWTLTVQVSGGPVLAVSKTLEVEAYDKIDIAVDPAAEHEVELQPGGANQVSLLLIRSDLYDPKLSFKAVDDSGESAAVVLDQPQLYSGGAVKLFGKDPHRLKIKNEFPAGDPSKRATVEILVGRDATP